MEVIGKIIKELREEKDWSQIELSKLIEVSKEDVSRMEGGKRKTYPVELLIKLSEVVDVSIDYLCKGEGLRYIITDEDIAFYEIYKKEKIISNNHDKDVTAAVRRAREVKLMKLYKILKDAVEDAQDLGLLKLSDDNE